MTKTKRKDLEKWLSETAELLVTQTLDIIENAKTPDAKEDLNKALALTFLSQYMEVLVSNALKDYENHKLEGLKAAEHTNNEFHQIKMDLQEAVCVAMEQSTKKFSGVTMEYMCDIRPFPEPLNKEPC